VEAVFDELKTHLRQQRRTLRSKTPDLVRQYSPKGTDLSGYSQDQLDAIAGATRRRPLN
jgi:IS30 family transposase